MMTDRNEVLHRDARRVVEGREPKPDGYWEGYAAGMRAGKTLMMREVVKLWVRGLPEAEQTDALALVRRFDEEYASRHLNRREDGR